MNVNVPIFNGFLYFARSKEAEERAKASGEQLRDLKNRIANDVRTSWLNTITAYNRISVSQQFVDQSNLALSLSQTRYNLGLSSIVELSQAQLAADAGANPVCGSQVSVQDCRVSAALPDLSAVREVDDLRIAKVKRCDVLNCHLEEGFSPT